MEQLLSSESIGIFVGTLGILLTIITFLATRRKKRLVYYTSTYQKIKQRNDDRQKIKVYFNNKEVPRVSTTYIWIWNEGRRAIKKNDIPKEGTVTIKLENGEEQFQILEDTILKVTRKETNLTISKIDECHFTLDFEFLAYRDGALIEIQHTGDAEIKAAVNGIILDDSEPIKRKRMLAIIPRPGAKGLKWFNRIIGCFFILTVAPTIALGIATFLYLILVGDIPNPPQNIVITRSDLSTALEEQIPAITEQEKVNIISEVTGRPPPDENLYLTLMIAITTILGIAMIWIGIPTFRQGNIPRDLIDFDK